MAVEFRGESPLGIIGVDDRDVLQAEHGLRPPHCIPQTRIARDIVSGGGQVARVQTIPDGIGNTRRGKFVELLQFLESAADGVAGARGIFEQKGEMRRRLQFG